MDKLVALMVAAVVAVGCSGGPGQRAEDTAAALRTADEAFARAVLDHDQRAFADAVAEDAVFHGTTVLRGRVAVVEAWAPLLAEDRATTLTWKPEHAEAAASGDLGYTRGTYRLTRRDGGGAQSTFEGSYVTVWRRGVDGTWRAAVDIGTDPRPLG